VVSDALTDFTDLLPTFAELAGAAVPEGLEIDGVSIAPVLLGKAKDSPREWIMALGHGAGTCDEKGVRGKNDFADRVIRDKRHKVWIDTSRTITRLHDLKIDPYEETNLLSSTDAEHTAALRKFQAVLDGLPTADARPQYEPRAANPWDRKPGAAKTKAKRQTTPKKSKQAEP